MNILSSVLVLVICKINFDFAQLMKSEREDKENVKTEEKLEKVSETFLSTVLIFNTLNLILITRR